jgi:hypothetical protein
MPVWFLMQSFKYDLLSQTKVLASILCLLSVATAIQMVSGQQDAQETLSGNDVAVQVRHLRNA